MGFTIPLNDWLNNQLKDWAEDSLNSIASDDQYLNKKHIDTLWTEFKKGNIDDEDNFNPRELEEVGINQDSDIENNLSSDNNSSTNDSNRLRNKRSNKQIFRKC